MNRLMALLLIIGGILGTGYRGAWAQELFTGYYFEDRETNPEDPTMGTISIGTPIDDGAFTAVMDFTFYGCQRSSSGRVEGQKTEQFLKGKWSGTTDGRPQTGSFDAVRDEDGYTGTYTVDDGKQLIAVDGCIRYYVAPRGEFRLVKSEQAKPNEDGQYAVEDNRARIATDNRRVGVTLLDPNAVYVVSISYVMPGPTRNWVLRPARQRLVQGGEVHFEFDELKKEFDGTLGPFDDGWYLITVNSVNPRKGAAPAITELFFPMR